MSRSVNQAHCPGAIIHAKAVVQAKELVLMTTMNLTPIVRDRNVEAGSPGPRPVPRTDTRSPFRTPH